MLLGHVDVVDQDVEVGLLGWVALGPVRAVVAEGALEGKGRDPVRGTESDPAR